MSEITGKNIVLTGGARGMGRLMAMKMARLGGRVVVYDVAAEALEARSAPPAGRRVATSATSQIVGRSTAWPPR